MELPSSTWVQYIKQLGHDKVQGSEGQDTSLLRFLELMEARREPALRADQTLNANFGLYIIGNRMQNIESAHVQVVGRRADYACISCHHNFGP